MPILNKKQMTEENIKLHYITPAITDKWDVGYITMETKIMDGKINLKGNLVVRDKPKKADYVLYRIVAKLEELWMTNRKMRTS